MMPICWRETPGCTISVLVVDDHELVRQTIRSSLEAHPDLRVVGEAVDGREAIHLTQEVRPDVILMDIYMPQMDGLEAARRINTLVPPPCIIGMSTDSSSWLKEAFLAAGAHAFLPKGWFSPI